MFFNTPKNSSKLKRTIYLFCATIAGLILSLIAHALIEIGYLRWAASQNLVATFYHGCALMPVLQISLWVFGIIGGFLLGRFWWRKVYIEKVWAKK